MLSLTKRYAKNYHSYTIFFAIALILIAFIEPKNCAAIESKTNRREIVTKRSRKFLNTPKKRQFLAIGGLYASDHNSRDFDFNLRYFLKSQKYVNEINFTNENQYRDSGYGENKRYKVKKSQRYDLVLSSKIKIENSNNYLAIFHRTLFDHLSNYYFDIQNAAGIGKSLLRQKIEFDISLGYNNTRFEGNKINFIPSIRANFKINKKLKLILRGYWFIDNESFDNNLKTRLIYKMSKQTSIELRHNFEQRRYEIDGKITNQVNKNVNFGVIFSL